MKVHFLAAILVIVLGVSITFAAPQKKMVRRREIIKIVKPPKVRKGENAVENNVEVNPSLNVTVDGGSSSNTPLSVQSQPSVDNHEVERTSKPVEIYHEHQQIVPATYDPSRLTPVQVNINDDPTKFAQASNFAWFPQAVWFQNMLMQSQMMNWSAMMSVMRANNPWMSPRYGVPSRLVIPKGLTEKERKEWIEKHSEHRYEENLLSLPGGYWPGEAYPTPYYHPAAYFDSPERTHYVIGEDHETYSGKLIPTPKPVEHHH